MIDVLLQIGIAKLLVSCVLAGLALVVGRRVGHPAFIHRFWLLVLVVLLLPAVVAIPVLPGEGAAAAVGVDGMALAADATTQISANASDGRPEPGTPLPVRITDDAKVGLVITWLLGTALLFGWTLVRVLRFRHWLVRTSQPAPAELRDEVSGIGRKLGLTRMPAVHTTTAPCVPDGVLDRRQDPHRRSGVPPGQPESARTPRHAGPRARTRPQTRPPGALDRMARVLGLLVEPGRVVGPA